MKLLKLLCFTMFFNITFSLNAQNDSINISAESFFSSSQKQYQPHYAIFNRYGKISDQQTDALLSMEASYIKALKNFKFAMGTEMLYKPYIQDLFPQQAYASVAFKQLELKMGKFEQVIGLVPDDLTTGSLGISKNARPIPQINLSVNEYTNVPFTKGMLQFKGEYLHGWLEADRFTASPYLHTKSGYLRTGDFLPFELYFGGAHFAVWGGEHPVRGPILSRFNDYVAVILGREASDDTGLGGEIMNAAGSHLGIIEYGFKKEFDNEYNLWVYTQIPFEDRSGFRVQNVDRLVGISLEFPEKSKFFKHLVYEFLNTRHQSGPGIPDPIDGQDNYGYRYYGRDDYYNNYLYKTGWVYHNMIIGTPLFMTLTRADHFFDDIENYGEVVNNRVLAHHIGLQGYLGNRFSWNWLSTYSKNYGTYAGLNGGRFRWGSREPWFDETAYEFYNPLYQLNFLLNFNYHVPGSNNLQFGLGTAIDYGDISRNVSVLSSIKYSVSNRF